MMWGQFIATLVIIVGCVDAYRDNDLTAEIPAGRKECYFQTAKAGISMEMEYQVIDGGDLDINVEIIAPDGSKVVSEIRKSDGIHTIDPTLEGDYEICFDNTFSRITKKTIYFELVLDNGDDDELDDNEGEWKKHISPDEAYGDQLINMEEKITVIKSNQAKTVQLQGILRAYEARDRNIIERNFSRINFWSVTNMIVMVLVVILQVFMVRNMFADRRKVRT